MFVFILVCITLYLFEFCNHLAEEERAGCLLSYGCLVTVDVLSSFLTVPRVGLQCVIVIFPDHTHLLFFSLITIYYVG